jgi:hypothetical protein
MRIALKSGVTLSRAGSSISANPVLNLKPTCRREYDRPRRTFMLGNSKALRACVSGAIFACLGSFAPAGAQAQQDQQRIMMIQSRLTKDGKAADFRKFAETVWKKFAQAAVDEGVYQSAMVIRLTAPFAAGAPADYAVVTFPTKRPSLAGPDAAVGERIAKRAGLPNLKTYVDGLNASSSVTKAEWLTTEASAGSTKAGNYILSWRWKVPQDRQAEQVAFAREISMPLRSQAIKDGKLGGTGFMTPVSAFGGQDGYNLMSYVVLNDADAFWVGPQAVTEERLKQVFPNGIDFRTYMNRLHQINGERKGEIMRAWEVVAAVGKSPEITLAKKD